VIGGESRHLNTGQSTHFVLFLIISMVLVVSVISMVPIFSVLVVNGIGHLSYA
jgi:hypothetical protein